MSRRMRLIWRRLEVIPLVGATADVLASEAAKLSGVTVPIPWLFTAIGVVAMLGVAVARAYAIPLIPEGLETPDEQLTRRSRILSERLRATPVRVFVAELPKLRGKVDTFIDGYDLFVSKRVAEMPEAEGDFVLARALVARGPAGRLNAWLVTYGAIYLVLMSAYFVSAFSGILSGEKRIWVSVVLRFFLPGLPLGFFALKAIATRKLGLQMDETVAAIAVRATGNPTAAVLALHTLAGNAAQTRAAGRDIALLEKWWNSTGQKAVEASEWYNRERGLAAKAE